MLHHFALLQGFRPMVSPSLTPRQPSRLSSRRPVNGSSEERPSGVTCAATEPARRTMDPVVDCAFYFRTTTPQAQLVGMRRGSKAKDVSHVISVCGLSCTESARRVRADSAASCAAP